MVALSATPGTDLQAVRAMLQNLLISRIELRNEESPDIVKYTHHRKIEKVVVGLSEELKSVKEKYLAVLEHFVKRLSQSGVLSESEHVIHRPRDVWSHGSWFSITCWPKKQCFPTRPALTPPINGTQYCTNQVPMLPLVKY